MKKDNLISLSVATSFAWIIGWGVAWVQSYISFVVVIVTSLGLIAFLSICIKRFSDPENLLLPHLRNLPYDDADGSYPEYKGQVRTHYKILNRGALDSKSWKLYIARNNSGELSIVDKNGFSFSSKKEGTLIPTHGERGFFVPSIIQGDDRYDNFNGLMLVRIIYTNVRDKKYCTCRLYNNGKEQDAYINTEAEEKKILMKVNMNRECKDCRWVKLVK